MNKILAVMALAITSVSAHATGVMSDFDDGTTQGWHIGPRSHDHINVSVGAEDNGNTFLKYTTDDSGAHDTRIALMAGKEYRGNYNNMGVTSVVAKMKNLGDSTLNMHLAFGNSLAGLRARYATEAVELVNDGEWHEMEFSLTENLHFVPIGGHGSSRAEFTVEEVLANIVNLRFTQGVFGEVYHERRGEFNGYNAGEELVNAELWIDDIQLSSMSTSGDVGGTGGVSAVPVPGAVWLFTSAIAGLAVSRKRAA